MLTFAVFFNSDEFMIYLYNIIVEFQLICFSEMWPKSYNEDDVCFNGYKPVVASCQGDLLGGGVALLIKDNLDYEPLSKEKYKCFSSFEFLSVKVFLYIQPILGLCQLRTT